MRLILEATKIAECSGVAVLSQLFQAAVENPLHPSNHAW